MSAVTEWFRPTPDEVTAITAAQLRERYDGDPLHGAGVQATEAWIRRTCPSWCTSDHARDFDPPALSCVHWVDVGSVSLADSKRPARIAVSLVVDFSTDAATSVEVPMIHVDYGADAPQRPETVRAIAELFTQAAAVCERIESSDPASSPRH